MTAQTYAKPEVNTSASDDLTHLYCCDDELALCGLDLRGVPENLDPDALMCVVCVDLSPLACWWCGP